MVRFLRNATVAKVAGTDSPLLQISTDERQQVARWPSFSAKKNFGPAFARSCCCTHGESLATARSSVSVLELGLLKMAHAQRLIPLGSVPEAMSA